MGTFHSVFSRILRENAERIGFTDIFSTVLERLEKDRPAAPESVDDILAIDRETRAKTREALGLA